MTGAILLLAIWATLRMAPETQLARSLHRLMVELPAAALARITRAHVLVALTILSLVLVLAWLGQGDGVRVLGMAVPEAWAWLTTFEVSAYLDAVAAIALASAAMRLKGLKARSSAWTQRLPRRTWGHPRPRCSRRRPTAAPANDDEDGTGFALAS